MPKANIGTQSRLDPRRRHMYKLYIEGKPLAEIVDIIRKDYKVSKAALYLDWKHRTEWGKYVIPEEDERFIVQDALNRINSLRKKMHEIIDDPHTTNAEKISAIGRLFKLELKILEAFQSLGMVHREATTIRLDEERDQLKTIVKNIAGEDIEKRESLVEALLDFATNASGYDQN